jgi:hypothetical protein
MELRHRIYQFSNGPKFDLLKSFLEGLECAYQFHENGPLSLIEYRFSEVDPQASVLKEFVTIHDITLQSALYYKEGEINNSEWVIVTVGEFQYPQPDGYIEVTYDTQNYCSRCGQGAVQDQPFRLKKDFVQKQAKFLGLHWVFDEIFVRPEIKRIFDANGISGVEYIDVIHHKTGIPFNNVYQMKITEIALPGLITENLFSVTCKPQNEESYIKGLGQRIDMPGPPFCGRIKYHYPLTEPIKYKADILKELPDFAKSYEYFGSGGLAYRFMLARNKVVRLIEELGLEGLGFTRLVHLV